MKTLFMFAFAWCAAMGFAETPGILQEIPADYCGTYYLHEKQVRKSEYFSPAQPFSRIEARQITLDGGNILKVQSAERNPAQNGSTAVESLFVRFQETNLTWNIARMSDSTIGIFQQDLNPKPVPLVWFGVSQNTNALQYRDAYNNWLRLSKEQKPDGRRTVSVETPPNSGEFPTNCFGTCYLHEKQYSSGRREQFSPPKPFGRIEARQITFDGGNIFHVRSIEHFAYPVQYSQPVHPFLARFEETNLIWQIMEMSETTFSILQFGADTTNPDTILWLGVSHDSDSSRYRIAYDNSWKKLPKDLPQVVAAKKNQPVRIFMTQLRRWAMVGVVLLGIYGIVRYRKWRIGLYFGAWAVALLLLGIPMILGGGVVGSPWNVLVFIPMFPMGLAYGLAPLLHLPNSWGMILIGGGYVFYLAHAIITFGFSHKIRFAVMYGILLVALAVNIAGCCGLGSFHPN